MIDADFVAAALSAVILVLGSLLAVGGRRLAVTRRRLGVAEADLKAMERQVAEAREAVRRANDAKTRFLAAASHDLRQPLQAVTMFTNVLANRVRDDKQREIVGRIEDSLEALRDLLNALVDVSKLEAGLVTAKPVEVAIGDILEQLVREFAPQAAAKGVEMRQMPSRLLVRTDPMLIERLLRNLLGNAVRFTDQGRILIGCRRAGDVVRIVVADTGIGIPADHLEAIFHEFHQVSNEARDRRKGLGLGLAIVDRLGAVLGHRITVRSIPGRGTVFAVEVPLVAASASLPATVAESVTPSSPSERTLVAVIDDDPDVLLSMRLALEQVGLQVAAAASALDCVKGLAVAPDAIIADYRLADGATGSEAIRLLQDRFHRPIPGLLVTGDTSPQRLRDARASGFRVLHKPIRPEELRSALDKLLRRPAA
ncbi:MAG: hybrid sensor histidine kinase/response regulator [Alphaproteobacteria bacterium]